MANEKNLKPVRTKKEARERGARGGKKSGEAKRKKKLLKECLEELLEKEWENRNGEKMAGSEAISVALFRKALAGDMKAFEIVRDTAGQKPIDKVMLAEVDQNTINEVEKMVLGAENDNSKAGN